MTVLAVLTVLQSTLPSFRLSYKVQGQEPTVTVLTVLAVSGCGGFGRDGYPLLNSIPLFRHPEINRQLPDN